MAGNDELTYGRHLRLAELLNAQHPVSDSHDEWLFIIQHQTSELWMKLLLVELDKARRDMRVGAPRFMLKALGRVEIVFRQLVTSWDVLRTLEPVDFVTFRGELGTASGFQSWQYRLIEYRLGNRDLSQIESHAEGSQGRVALEAELEELSVYQTALRLLAETLEVSLPDECFRRDTPYRSSMAVEKAWTEVYRAPNQYRDLHDLAEALVRVEDVFRCWRFNHVTTVERVIGMRRGTGGTSGVGYLRKMLEVEHFPELWRLRVGL